MFQLWRLEKPLLDQGAIRFGYWQAAKYFQVQPPKLDGLAADGVLFENAFATTAICCSSRASILTGQHMGRHGIRDFHTPLSADAMDQTLEIHPIP